MVTTLPINLSAAAHIYSKGGETRRQPRHTMEDIYSRFPLYGCVFVSCDEEGIFNRMPPQSRCVDSKRVGDSSEDSGPPVDPRSVNKAVRRR